MPLFTLITLTCLQFRAANSLRSFRNMSTNPLQGRLTYYDGPLVWIDCEMTGLDYKKDRILEIAVIILDPTCPSGSYLLPCPQILITNGNLEIVDDGMEFVIRTEKSVLDKFDSIFQIQNMVQYAKDYDSMGEWCVKQHGAVRSFSVRIFANLKR